MAWSSSNLNAVYGVQMGTNAVKPSTDSFRAALFGNNVTPTQSSTVASNEYSATWATTGGNSEITAGGGYTAGGGTAGNLTASWTQSPGSTAANVFGLYSNTNLVWNITGSSSAAYGCIVYDLTAASTNIIMSWNWFGGTGYAITGSGTFTLQWGGNGVNTFTC